MKTRNYLFLFAAICNLMLVLSACFSPLGYKSGDTTLSVGFGGGGLPRTVIDPSELTYEITFSGPGGREFTEYAEWGETKTVQVVVGSWNISVRAFDPAIPGITSAIGETNNIDVRAGQQNEAKVEMAVYAEVSTWTELGDIIGNNPNYNVFIVIDGPINIPAGETTIISPPTTKVNKTITLVSRDSSQGIIRRNGFNGLLFNLANNTTLILGSITGGFDKTLTLDGNNAGTGNLFDIQAGSTLIMNNQAILEYNASTAVNCRGSFIMNGGIITNNGSTDTVGGGVTVSGVFTMKGGTIGPGNRASEGGGINIATNGSVIMENGRIIDNTAANTGGGVRINPSGTTFTMSGGEITGNTATSLGNGVFNAGTFNMSGSAFIDANNHVHLPSGSTITVQGNLSVSVAANIVPASYIPGTAVLSGSPSLVAANSTRFRITRNTINLPIINSAGSLTSIMEMVQIYGGTFTMGSIDPQDLYASPERQVTLSSFNIGKYPVTQAQYLEVTGTNPSYYTGNLNRPVDQVTWFDAIEFCNKLSEMEGLTPVYTINDRTPATGYPITNATVIEDWNATGYRLPTEAEWEYACRAGTTTPWSHDESLHNDYMWINTNSGWSTHPVGQKLENPWGLYDMLGNVYEWCWDWFETYPNIDETNPTGALTGTVRVQRGASWSYSAQYARSACRNTNPPSDRNGNNGFRVVKL